MYVFKKVSDYNFLNKGESVKFERTIMMTHSSFQKDFSNGFQKVCGKLTLCRLDI